MNRNTGMNAGQIIGTMNGQQVVGLDIAKQMFQATDGRVGAENACGRSNLLHVTMTRRIKLVT